MQKQTICQYRDISERDMDMLFMEAFVTDPDFAAIFLNKLGRNESSFDIVKAERSKIDHGLGESDLTIIFRIGDLRHALLIEDKIDAPAMEDQCRRYLERGRVGVARNEYDSFDVFMVCPKQYAAGNEEAQKYPNLVTYEECRDYFRSKEDMLNSLRYQKICQALETAKAEYKLNLNEIALDSFQKYAEYQKLHFGRLSLMSKVDSNKVNGWWPQFKTALPNMYIIHKTNKGYVDLTVRGAADRVGEFQLLEKWLRHQEERPVTVIRTGKSAAFRIVVPVISMGQPFASWKMGDLHSCFGAIQQLVDLAGMFEVIAGIVSK